MNLRPRNHIQVETGDGNDQVTYVQNAPVDIDGGTGIDTVAITGTAANDTFVMLGNLILGAGIITTFNNVERMEVDGGAGNDQFYVLDTHADLETILQGGSGDDQFHLGGLPPALYFDRPAFTYFPPAYLLNVQRINPLSANPVDRQIIGMETITPQPIVIDPVPFIFAADAVFDVSRFAGRITLIGDEAYEVNSDRNSVVGDELIVHNQQVTSGTTLSLSSTSRSGSTVYGIKDLIDTGMGKNGSLTYFGVEYEQLEQLEIRFGDHNDNVTVNALPDGTVAELVLAAGDDRVVLNALGAGVRVLGGAGNDRSSRLRRYLPLI